MRRIVLAVLMITALVALPLVALPAQAEEHGHTVALLATLAAILLSGVMEAVQTYLPTRVSSNLDLLTNSIGGLSGAVLGAVFRHRFGPESKLLQLRERLDGDQEIFHFLGRPAEGSTEFLCTRSAALTRP